MGARPSSFRKSGGFLNGIDGTIMGYRWTDEFNGQPFVPGKKPDGKGEKFHSLQFELAVRVDGAESNITQSLFGGGFVDYDISEDGLTLTALDGGKCSIGQDTGVAKLVSSIVSAGEAGKTFSEDELSDDPNSINLEPIIGLRVRFGQAVEIDKKTGKARQRAGKGKFVGKFFDQTTTIVEAVYGRTEVVAVPKGGKPAKSSAKVAGKVSKSTVDVNELAVETLMRIVAEADGSIKKSKLSMATLKALIGNPHTDAVRKLLNDVEFLGSVDGLSYDEETQTVSAD